MRKIKKLGVKIKLGVKTIKNRREIISYEEGNKCRSIFFYFRTVK